MKKEEVLKMTPEEHLDKAIEFAEVNTPDTEMPLPLTECKWCGRKSEIVDMGNCPFCEKTTPDTEWSQIIENEKATVTIRDNQWLDRLSQLLITSRDTYWKERVRKETERRVKEVEQAYDIGYNDGQHDD